MMAGRLCAYAAAGAMAAVIVQTGAWLAESMAWVRPLWLAAQLMLLVLGLVLLIQGQFPLALLAKFEALRPRHGRGGGVLHGAQATGTSAGRLRVFGLALLWPAVPCGVLQAALLMAALASSAVEGAAIMVVFGLASMPGLWFGRSLWGRLRNMWRAQRAAQSASTPVQVVRPGASLVPFVDTVPLRLAGLALAASAGWWLIGQRIAPTIAAWCA